MTSRSSTCEQKLRGHYLRGWSGSLAYDLSLRGAQWDGTEGADRARHTIGSFFANYYRETMHRQLVAFDEHSHGPKGKNDMRLEEALVL